MRDFYAYNEGNLYLNCLNEKTNKLGFVPKQTAKNAIRPSSQGSRIISFESPYFWLYHNK